MGLGIRNEPVLVSTGGGTFGWRIKTYEEEKQNTKNTKKTQPWKMGPAVDAKCRMAEICKKRTQGSVLAWREASFLLRRLLLLY